MSGGGGKGGSQSSATTIPKFMEDAAKQNLARADQVSQIGYTPYYGPDVAAMTPMQMAAFGNTNQAAQAFGMGAPTDLGLPQANTYAGGVQGYSSGGLFDQALRALEQNRPGQYGAINDMFIDPVTGEPAVYQPPPPPQPGFMRGSVSNGGGGSDRDYASHTQGVMDRSASVSQQSQNNATSGSGGLY